jgi:hypothetical protein
LSKKFVGATQGFSLSGADAHQSSVGSNADRSGTVRAKLKTAPFQSTVKLIQVLVVLSQMKEPVGVGFR